MDLSTITRSVLYDIKEELKTVDNINIIKKDILKPLIHIVIEELYPYIFRIILIFILILLFLFVTIFLNLRIIYQN